MLMVLAMCLSLLPASTLAAGTTIGTGNASTTLTNDCDAAVKYSITLDGETTEVTLDGHDTLTMKGDKGDPYTVEWVGGADSNYVYTEEPANKTLTGTIGEVTTTRYYYTNSENGGECTNEVANTVSYGGYTMATEGNVYYDVESLVTFKRTGGWGFTYTNVNDPDDKYDSGWSTSDSTAYNKVYNAYPTYDHTRAVDGALVPDESYMFMYKTVEPRAVTTAGDANVTFTATAIKSGTTGNFTVAALNVDGMPENVDITVLGQPVKTLNLNDDGPKESGSELIGQYIEESGIDILALSEDFNYYSQIEKNATSYATGTQRLQEGIPTSVSVTEALTSIEFPLDTDGLNLMYKKGLTVSGETMVHWNEHYSPTTFYGIGNLGINVPDQYGADGMIDKGYRFYQVKVASGVVVDVYILHMDADVSQGDLDARASQIDQLMATVDANDNGNPIIIMGDTNCRYTRDPLESKIINAGFSDPWVDLEYNGVCPTYPSDSLMVGDLGYQKGEVVDKVFYKNAAGSNLTIEAVSYKVDANGYTDADGLLGDHPPVIVEFKYTLKSNNQEHEHNWSTDWSSNEGHHWHECLNDNCDATMNSEKNGYQAHSWDEISTTPATCTETGSKTLKCSVCGYSKDEVIPATGHTWGEGEVTIQPTTTTEGEMTYTCTVCGATDTAPIPKLDVEYTFTLTFDKESYNVGETATATISLSKKEGTGSVGAIGFALGVPTGLTMGTITNKVANAAASIENGIYGINVNSGTSLAVDGTGVEIATVTFTVTSNFDGESTEVTLGLNQHEVTLIDEYIPRGSEVATDSATLVKSYTVNLAAGEHVSFEGATSITVTAGTTFGGLTLPEVTVDQYYEFDGWYNGETKMTDGMAVTGGMTLTAKATPKTYTFTEPTADNATIGNLTGVTGGKATYGTDIAFTVTPDSSYVIGDVSYTVGEDTAAHTLNAVNGVYTIPGSAITDDITVYVTAVQYHTVRFVAGEGTTMDTVTAYVMHGQSALYTGTDFKTLFTVPSPEAEDGYRLAADTAAESLWSDGTNKYQSSALGSSVTFNADTTLTAQAVKQWTVTFQAGTNGSFAQDAVTKLTVDTGTQLTQAQIPSVTANTGYTFTGWDNNVSAAITADTVFTAQYTNATYTLTLPNISGVTFTVTGATSSGNAYTVTHGSDVTIDVTVDPNKADVKSISYTIGNGELVTVTDFSSGITIQGSDIIGNINLTVDSTAVYAITVEVADGIGGTVNGVTTSTKYFNKDTSAADVAKAFTIVAADGYEFVPPTFEDVDGDATYTVDFTLKTYTVSWPDGVTDMASEATHGTDFTFQLSLTNNQLLLGDVEYRVGDSGGFNTLTANADGSYTIPGDDITGPITVKYTTVNATWEFITEEAYKAAPDGKQVAILNTTKLNEGTYALNGYGDMFWSEKYNGYVYFVNKDETAATLTQNLAVSQNTVTEIDYSGDINGVGGVTPADSAPINAVLHDVTVEYEISDLMRFQFDVTGDKKVTAQDIIWILNEYTGASNED